MQSADKRAAPSTGSHRRIQAPNVSAHTKMASAERRFSTLLAYTHGFVKYTELKKLSSTTFQRSPLCVCEKEEGYRTALEHIQLKVLQDKFTGFMFPPFFVSIAGALTKCKSTYWGLSEARLNSDVAVLSNRGLSNSQRISAVRFVPISQISLLWRTPWTCTTFGRAYASAAESRKREIRVSNEVDDDDDDGDAGELSDFEEDSDVEDEQRIEDSDDEEEEDQQQPQTQGLTKKKIQTKVHKSKLPDQQRRLLNESIMARTIRLVIDDGKSHRVVSRDEALTLAKGKKMDLVLVDGRSNPPVCKIYDFNKEEYKQEQILKVRKKQKGAMARLSEVKELRFNSKTEPKDLKMKVEQAKEFMNRGHRVKFVAIFKGKPDDEIKRLEEEKMIDAIFPLIEDVAVIEQGPRVESRQAWVMLRHVKFAKKKPPKREPQVSATEQVESVKQEDHVYSEQVFYQGREETIMHSQNVSSTSEAAAMRRLQGDPSKLTSPSIKPFAFQSPHPQAQPSPPQNIGEAFSSQIYSPPLHRFPRDTQSLQGFGGSQGSERAVSPSPGPLPSVPTSQRTGVQGFKIQSLRPSVSPTSNLQGAEGTQIQKPQSSPLDGMSPPQSEHHPSHIPKMQLFSMPFQSGETLSQKQSSNSAPHPDKAIGSEVIQGEYPAISRGRGIPPPNQPPHSLFSATPPTSLQGSPSNLQGPLLNFSQSPPRPPVTHVHGPSNFRSPLPNASPSTSLISSHQGGLANLESDLTDSFSSPPPPTVQHASSSSQGSNLDPLSFVSIQNVQVTYPPPLQWSEGLPPRGAPQYSPSPLRGLAPRGVPGYPPPPLGQPRYSFPPGHPNFQGLQRPQGEFAPSNQNQQLRGPDFMHQMLSQPQPALDAAAQSFPQQQQNYRPKQGQDRYAPAPNIFGSPERPQQEPPNLFGCPQSPQHGPPNHPQQGPPNLFGPPQRPQQGPPSLFGAPKHPQQGPPNLFGPPQRPQQGPPSFVGSPQLPQQGPPNPFGSPLHPQQGPRNVCGAPPGPQQEPSNRFGFQPYLQQGPPEPSQIQFGYQPVGVPQGPRHWLSQQALSRDPLSMPSHPQQTDHQPPSQSHQGYFAQQEAEGGGQNYWQSQALQGYPPPQNQAPQGYPPQRGFPQTRVGQGAFGFQGSHTQNQASQQSPPPRGFPQNQASQQSPPPRGFPQTRPVVPSPPGFRPAWSTPPQSQEYSPLFESPSDKS